MKPGYISIYDLRQDLLKIREAALKTGLTPRAIRYYESLGLLPHMNRSRGKMRLYTAADCTRLQQIKDLRAAGKSLPEIQQELQQPALSRKIGILVDSAFSISVAAAANYGLQLIPDTIHFGTSSYKDYTTLAPAAYVGVVSRKRLSATTEPPSREEYVALFTQAFAQGFSEVVSLHPDQRLSRSYERALAAAKHIPQFAVTVIDTKLMSQGFHFVAPYLRSCASVSAIEKLIQKYQSEITEFVLLGDLTHLVKTTEGLGSLVMDFVPLLQHTAADGLVSVARLDSLEEAMRYIDKHAQGFAQYRVGYSSDELYKKLQPQLKHLSITAADFYSSVVMVNLSEQLIGIAALR